jgi:hypothetical protein
VLLPNEDAQNPAVLRGPGNGCSPGEAPLAGGRGVPLDYKELEHWTRVGYERGIASRKGER